MAAKQAWQLKSSTLVEGGLSVKGYTSIEFGIEQAKNNNHGADGTVYSMSEGIEEYSGTIEYYASEVNDMCRSGNVATMNRLPPQDMQWIIATADGQLATHIFKNRRYTGHPVTIDNEGEDAKMSVGFTYTDIIIQR